VHGTAVWSSSEWRAEAVAWLDEQLAAAGLERGGAVEQPHLRPWATALRAPTTGGTVWLKAPGPGTAFEVRLYELLARAAPDRVLRPIATDPVRNWVLLPDGGPPLGVRLGEPDRAEALAAALDHHGSEADREAHRRVTALGRTVTGWCEQLAASAVPPSLDHNDLHPWNVLGAGRGDTRFYDWGDSVVAHPFAALLVPLGFVRRDLGLTLDEPRFAGYRDAYLEVFSDLAGGEDLAATLETACRVAKIARVLTWERAVRAAREDGEVLKGSWATAPIRTLASVLDDSYLGGA